MTDLKCDVAIVFTDFLQVTLPHNIFYYLVFTILVLGVCHLHVTSVNDCLCLYSCTIGQYRFAVASDDTSEVWLSTDHQPKNLKKICCVGCIDPVS